MQAGGPGRTETDAEISNEALCGAPGQGSPCVCVGSRVWSCRLLACPPMLISFACMSEKGPGRRVCLSRGGGPADWPPGWAYLEPGSSRPGGDLCSDSCFSVSLALRGAGVGGAGFPPGPPLPLPATSQSWLALTTGSSLASAQTQAGACPSGRLSLNTGPPATPPPRDRAAEAASLDPPRSPSQMARLFIALCTPLLCTGPQTHPTAHAGRDPVWGSEGADTPPPPSRDRV